MSTTKDSGVSNRWDEAIRDAEKRIRKLQTTIRTLEEKREKGERWPCNITRKSGDRLYSGKEAV